jgi:hypothetical protein
MALEKIRIRFPAGGDALSALTVMVGAEADDARMTNVIPGKDFCIVDDMMTVADSASFTVANVDGENAGKITLGQRVEIEESEQSVAGGQWTRIFTGRVVNIQYTSDISGGSVILVSCMDLGWHLTTCCARPLQGTSGIKLGALLQRLVDPSWGFKTTADGSLAIASGNVLNRSIKQGRQGVLRAQPRNPEDVLPPIQVEPGQVPWQILEEYFHREGFLLNVGAYGDIIVFDPDYFQPTQYAAIEFHPSDQGNRTDNNVVDRVSLKFDISEMSSRSQCWSTVVVPTEVEAKNIATDPNEQFKHAQYTPPSNPLPFDRLSVVTDPEAINSTMRQNRALWKYQMGQFDSLVYECTVVGHASKPKGAQTGVFWASDTMVSVNDEVNGLSGMMYVQRVEKSMTADRGTRTKLTLRRPGQLDPSLQAQVKDPVKKRSKKYAKTPTP